MRRGKSKKRALRANGRTGEWLTGAWRRDPSATRPSAVRRSRAASPHLLDAPRRHRVDQARGRAVGGGELADADARGHDVRRVRGVVEAEQVAHLVKRDRVDRAG